jgi:hypothetical protein
MMTTIQKIEKLLRESAEIGQETKQLIKTIKEALEQDSE